MAGAIGGMIFPLVCGIILDSYKHTGNQTLGYGILFGYCAASYLIALVIFNLLNPKLQHIGES